MYKNIDIYYIGYIIMKDSDYEKIKSVNPLHLIIREKDGHFERNSIEEKNGNNKQRSIKKVCRTARWN